MVFSLDHTVSGNKAFSRRQGNEQALTQSSKLGEGEEEESVFRDSMVQTEAHRTWYPIDLQVFPHQTDAAGKELCL